MGYVEENLISNEQVIHRAQLHWMIFTNWTLLGVLGSLFTLGIPIPLLLLIFPLIRMKTTEMAVTNKRVLIKTGLISRRTVEMNLSKIENIAVHQGILGRLLSYGSITVVGTGGTKEKFTMVASPLDFRRSVAGGLDSTAG